MAEGSFTLILREIRLGDKTNKLSLGNQNFVPLKIYLEKDAWQFHEENIAKTFVLNVRSISPADNSCNDSCDI